MTLYDLVSGMVDKRLPVFAGTGTVRDGKQVAFGKGRGRFFWAQCLCVLKINGKLIASNSAY